ncbi:hypothetical protein [Pantoea anthophila]|uniref:hypothetical protein n=1 Tax=Pantoea anthophila TaxID=470931 RepID=UPI003CF0406B
MSEFKGTPGPWLLSGNEIYTEEYGPHIAPLVVLQTHLGTTFDEDVANANLIAAAPELLAVLQETVEALKRAWNTGALPHDIILEDLAHRQIKVIAKALGQ